MSSTRTTVAANIQRHLRVAGFDPQHTSGAFDERTAVMVKQYQAKSKLPVTGSVDKRTWKSLQKSFILSSHAASPAQRLNERSGAVKASEKLLKIAQDGALGTRELALMKKDASGTCRTRAFEIAKKCSAFTRRAATATPSRPSFTAAPRPGAPTS